MSVTTGGGFVLVLVSGDCRAVVCSDGVLERFPVGSDDWEGLSLPVPVTPNWGATMTVVGRDVWISATPAPMSGHQLYGALLRSDDSGGALPHAREPLPPAVRRRARSGLARGRLGGVPHWDERRGAALDRRRGALVGSADGRS